MISLFSFNGNRYFIQHENSEMNQLNMLQLEQKLAKTQEINFINQNIKPTNLIYRKFTKFTVSNVLQYLSEDFYQGQTVDDCNFSNLYPSCNTTNELLILPDSQIFCNSELESAEEYVKTDDFPALNNCHALFNKSSLYLNDQRCVDVLNNIKNIPYAFYTGHYMHSEGLSFYVNQFFNLGYYFENLDFSKYNCLQDLISSNSSIQNTIENNNRKIDDEFHYAIFNCFNYLETKLKCMKDNISSISFAIN